MNAQELQNLAKLKQCGCKACIFCHTFESKLMECRKKAPVFEHGTEDSTAIFPQVQSENWCSEGHYSGDAEG